MVFKVEFVRHILVWICKERFNFTLILVDVLLSRIFSVGIVSIRSCALNLCIASLSNFSKCILFKQCEVIILSPLLVILVRNLPIWGINFIWSCHYRPILKGRRFSRVNVNLCLHVWRVKLFFVHKYAHDLPVFFVLNPVLNAIKVWRQITRLTGSFDSLLWDIWPAAIESHSFYSRLSHWSHEDVGRAGIQHVLVLFSFSKVVDYLCLICSVNIRLGYLFTQRQRISSLVILKPLLNLLIRRYRLRMGAFDHYFWQKLVLHGNFLLLFLLYLLCWLRLFSWLWLLYGLTCFEFNVERGAIASISNNKLIIPWNFLASKHLQSLGHWCCR